MASPTDGLDVTTAAIMIAIPALALASIALPVAFSEWRARQRNRKILAEKHRSR